MQIEPRLPTSLVIALASNNVVVAPGIAGDIMQDSFL
jgi:hypothetical protein